MRTDARRIFAFRAHAALRCVSIALSSGFHGIKPRELIAALRAGIPFNQFPLFIPCSCLTMQWKREIRRGVAFGRQISLPAQRFRTPRLIAQRKRGGFIQKKRTRRFAIHIKAVGEAQPRSGKRNPRAGDHHDASPVGAADWRKGIAAVVPICRPYGAKSLGGMPFRGLRFACPRLRSYAPTALFYCDSYHLGRT